MIYKWRWNTILRWLAIPAVVFAAWQVGIYAGRRGITYIEVLSGIMAIAGIIILGRGHSGLRVGYFVWIALLGLGYRTAEIGIVLKLHPLVILSNVLLLILLIYKIGEERAQIRIFIPRWLWLFTAFWLWGFFIAVVRGLFIEHILYTTFTFLLLIPVFVLTYHVLIRPRDWRLAIQIFYLVAVFIATMGILEYFVPGIRNLLPGFVGAGTSRGSDQFGFTRATFSFFGSPIATFTCAMAMPMLLVLYQWHKAPPTRIALLGSSALLMVAIYIGGYRSVWATVALVFIVVYALNRNLLQLGALLLLLVGVFALSPEAGVSRFSSLLSAAEGDFVDTSSQTRYNRADQALTDTLANPLGMGLAAAGWAHSDILQIAAETGVIGAVVFTVGLGQTVMRLARLYWRRKEPFDLALLGSLVVVISIYVFQTVTVLPQLAAPTFFVWAVAEAWLEREREAVRRAARRETTANAAPSVPPAPPGAQVPGYASQTQ